MWTGWAFGTHQHILRKETAMIVPERTHITESKHASELIEHIEPLDKDSLAELTSPLEETILEHLKEDEDTDEDGATKA